MERRPGYPELSSDHTPAVVRERTNTEMSTISQHFAPTCHGLLAQLPAPPPNSIPHESAFEQTAPQCDRAEVPVPGVRFPRFCDSHSQTVWVAQLSFELVLCFEPRSHSITQAAAGSFSCLPFLGCGGYARHSIPPVSWSGVARGISVLIQPTLLWFWNLSQATGVNHGVSRTPRIHQRDS